jgi:hypothetical protein
MTLQSNGAISFGDINVELGVARTTTRALGSAAARELAGVASGAIRTAADFYGKSSIVITFTPDGGTSAGTAVLLNSDVAYEPATISIDCSANATWNYVKTLDSGSGTESVSIANGNVSPDITFICDSESGLLARRTWSVNATANGVTRYWTVDLRSDYT